MHHTIQHTLFDTDWRFAQRDAPGAETVAFDDADWRVLDLPHDWSTEGSFSEDAPCGGGGGYLPGGVGCNGIRSRHYPPAPEFLDLCDRMGFLVMDENFDEWRMGKFPYGYHDHFDAWAVRDTVSMVRRDRNHPSIVIWSVGNEIPEQTVAEGVEILKMLMDAVRKEDPTRPVTSACDFIAAHVPVTDAFLEALDVVGYTYVDRWAERRELYSSIERQRYPQRRMIGTDHTTRG